MAVELKKAMAALATAANSCKWSKGQRAIEVLRNKLSEAEAAAEAAANGGAIPDEVRLQAVARSRLDARALTTCVQSLLENGHDEEARRLVKLCDRLDSDESAVASVMVEALPLGSPIAISRVSAIAHDGARPARVRLLALAWLISSNAARSAHVPVLDIIGTAIDRRDWDAAQMGMEALKYLLWCASATGYPRDEWGNRALLSVLEWPGRSEAEEDDGDYRHAPSWPDAAQMF